MHDTNFPINVTDFYKVLKVINNLFSYSPKSLITNTKKQNQIVYLKLPNLVLCIHMTHCLSFSLCLFTPTHI